MENCINQVEGEILTSVYNPILFRRKKMPGKKAVSFFSRKFSLKTKSTTNIVTGWFSKSDEESSPKTFGVMAVIVLVYSPQNLAGKP